MNAEIQAWFASAQAFNGSTRLRDRLINLMKTHGGTTITIGRATKDPIDKFMKSQVEKFRAGKELRCSDGLALKIRRKAIEEDMGV